MHTPLPLTRDLVLIGGGHAHALVLLDWAMNPLPGARLTVIDPNPTAPYTGMLPGHIAGHYTQADLEMNLTALARHAGAQLILGRAQAIDPVAQTVSVPGRPPVAYDVLSVDVGITSDLPDLPGYADHAVSAKPLGAYAARWVAFLAQVERGEAAPTVAVLGAGVAGVELALAMDHALAHRADRQISVIDRSQALPNLGRFARRRLLALLRDRGIALYEGAQVAQITAQGPETSAGTIAAALTIGAAGSRPQGWLAGSGLALTGGFIDVGESLQSTSHPSVFAVGDCAHMTHAPRPKAGVFAVRQAPFLAHNLRAALSGTAIKPYRPQADYLKLISLGGRDALADKWGLPLRGRWLWRQKDRIDQRFMHMFHHLPSMAPAPLPAQAAEGLAQMLGDKPLCGGCGAKVGPGILRAALSPGQDARNGDDAAVLAMGDTRQVIATDHLRAVVEDPWLMARIATVHALGDVWAMGATPQASLASVILPRQAEPLQARSMAEIMAGLRFELEAAGAALVGGHTTQGAELTIGLTVTGLLDGPARTKGGAQVGDVLILTKPLGSGTILAAEMLKHAPGRAVAALWASLTQSQGTASAILSPVAHAMTDVTGFGLAGHLDEIVSASGAIGATLDLSAIPLFDGALALATAGVASTVAPANRAALIGRMAAPTTPTAALLFDPQTCGGLMAAVPAAVAQDTLSRLTDAGYSAAIIGQITARPESGPPITAG